MNDLQALVTGSDLVPRSEILEAARQLLVALGDESLGAGFIEARDRLSDVVARA